MKIGDLPVLIKLLPEQLVKFWDMIRFAIAETFIPRESCTNEHLQAILTNLLSGKAQCWMGFKMVDGERKFVGFIITRIGIEEAIKEKVLFIDSVYAYESTTEELIKESMQTMEKFAIANECKTLASITESDRILHLAQRAGFKSRYYIYKGV